MATATHSEPTAADWVEVQQPDGSTLRFNELEHAYAIREKSAKDFRRTLSVTQILAAEGVVDFSMVKQAVVEYKRSVGSAAHAATDYIDKNCLDWGSVDEAVEGYINAYIAFLADTEFTVRMSEAQRIATVNGLRYGMKVDREGTIAVNGKLFPAVVELKCTSAPEDYWGIQLAFYDIGLGVPKETGKPRERFAVQLKPDGTYKLHPYQDRGDYGAAAGMIASVAWKLNHGYLKIG
jgi:hypothetical protein